jgi:hypothetical protein
MMSGPITPWSLAAKAPPPPRWTWRPPRAIVSTAVTASAASVPRAMSVSMLVARWRRRRTVERRNGQPPPSSTATASTSTLHPAKAVAGPNIASEKAAMDSTHAKMARTTQCSECSVARPAPSSSAWAAEYPAAATASQSSSLPTVVAS